MARPLHGIAALTIGLIACDGGSAPLTSADAAALADDAAPPADAVQADDATVSTGASPFSETCTPTGAPGRQLRAWGSNAAEIEGPPVGDGLEDTSRLRKKLTARLIAPNPMLELGDAYLTRDSTDGIGVDFIAEVRFLGPGTACFLRAIDIAWLTADGALADPEREISYVHGSVAVAGGRTSTSTCLTAGDLGYIIDLRISPRGQSLYDQTAAVELRFDPSWIPGSKPPASVHATSYVNCQEFRQIEVALESRGPEPAVFEQDSLGRYLLFDDGGAPLSWGFLATRRGLGRYPPGQVIVGGDTLFFDGTSRRMRMLADFSFSLFIPAPPATDQRGEALERLQAEHQRLGDRQRARWQQARGSRL
jgi:hypothetical protein